MKRVLSDSTRVSDAELRAAAPAFRRRIAYASPRAVCFTTTRAFDVLFAHARAAEAWGHQPVCVEGAAAWVMPSTSGRAAGYREHVHRVLRELAEWLRRRAAEGAP